MADADKAKDGAEPQVKDAAPQRTFKEFQDDAQARKDAEIQRVLSTAPSAAPAGKTTAEEPPTPPTYTSDKYEETFNALPEAFREEYSRRVIGWEHNRLAEQWGPDVVAVLKEDLKDPKTAKIFKALSSKEKREWLSDIALDIYDDPRFAAPAASDGEVRVDPKLAALENEVNSLKRARDEDAQRAQLAAYHAERRDEYTAFIADPKFSALRYDPAKVRFDTNGMIVPAPGVDASDRDVKNAKRVYAIIERAEQQTVKANRRISYADVGTELMDMWEAQAANPAPTPIPSTTTKTQPDKPQAPQSKVEVKARMAEQINRNGGTFSAFAERAKLARSLKS